MRDAVHPHPELSALLHDVYTLNRDTINLRLERSPYLELLERLGNPHLSTHLPPVIHVAGTNGKGSTLAFLKSILNQAGFRCHRYTSPHLHVFNERIMLCDQSVSDDVLLVALKNVLKANDGLPVTFFELTTALAFTLFAEYKSDADFLLLETGMGGRLDCTNAIDHPLLTIITSMGFDHMEYLGDTISKIAFEKAGIMKEGVACVLGPQEPRLESDILKVMQEKSGALNADLLVVDPKDMTRAYDLSRFSALKGAFQSYNIATTLKAVNALKTNGYAISEDHIEKGLAAAHWPARMEYIEQENFKASVPAGTSIYFDGGHNIQAAYHIANTLEHWKNASPERKIYALFGMQAGKDAGAFLSALQPYLNGVVVVDCLGGLHPQSATQLMEAMTPSEWLKSDIPLIMHDEQDSQSIEHCFQHIGLYDQNDPVLLVCGSLFNYHDWIKN